MKSMLYVILTAAVTVNKNKWITFFTVNGKVHFHFAELNVTLFENFRYGFGNIRSIKGYEIIFF